MYSSHMNSPLSLMFKTMQQTIITIRITEIILYIDLLKNTYLFIIFL